MGSIETLFHITDLASLHELCAYLGVADEHHIPLRKILFTLERKRYLSTVAIERAPDCPQYQAECDLHHKVSGGLQRLHFFAEKLTTVTAAKINEKIYGGYCDVRPNEGSIASAFITAKTVINSQADSYAFLPSFCSETVTIPCSDGTSSSTTLKGFAYIQKNNRETMCAQAALFGVVRYWQARRPGTFPSIRSTVDINRQAGIKDAEQKTASGRGLTLPEIQQFLSQTGVPAYVRDYTPCTLNTVRKERILQDIYGLIESGFPVIAAVKTDGGIHALTFIGHTFDKNSWQAMANVGYFALGAAVQAPYHPNVTWIENLIIHDDNFGPYYFLDMQGLENMIAGVVVALPGGSVILPNEASNSAVGKTLFSQSFQDFLKGFFAKYPLAPSNRKWYSDFVNHLQVKCGDGLVLRPLLRTIDEVVCAYAGHEFHSAISSVLAPDKGKKFWLVELSWPDIYCFRQATCGMVLVDAETGDIAMIHLPGLLLNLAKGKVTFCIAHNEDAPRPNQKPGSINL